MRGTESAEYTEDCTVGNRPSEGKCPVCGDTFLFPVRRQGGGSRKKYCTPRCRSLDWTRGNGGKRKAAVIKYDSIPENKEKKRLRTRKQTLAKYGLTNADFVRELARQRNVCLGCLSPIDENTARIDHDHDTGKVRGLLCDSCNWGIGHLKTQETMRRVMAYLDRDRTKTSIYLIGALKNQRIPAVGNLLRDEGYDVMDEWFTPGPEADENWQRYEKQRGRTYQEALRGRAATNIFLFDRSYLDLSDIAVLVMPAGKSAMLELGYAKGRGKPVYILLDGNEPERYDIMPNFAKVCFNLEELIADLQKLPSVLSRQK